MMYTILNLKKKACLSILLCVGMLLSSFSTFSQTPYNIVMNIYDDPTTKIAFNWFNAGVTGGTVKIMRNGNIVTTATTTYTYTQYSGNTINKAVVEGLASGTTYTFQVGGVNNYWSNIGTFTTAKNNKDSYTFIYTTDPQASEPWQFEIASTTSHKAFATHPDAKFWIACGDLVESGDWIDQWNQFFSKQQDLFLKVPFAPVRGNHDWSSNFNNHFNIENFGTDPGNSTYTYIYGDAQFFAINGELYNNSTYITNVKQWMRDSIAAHPEIKWRIVYYHKTAYTAGYHQNAPDCRAWRDAMTPIFDELNIDIAFQGHSHVYEVIGPVKNKDTVAGTINYVNSVQMDTATRTNITGKAGGIYNVREGTLYFLNSSNGHKQSPHDLPLRFREMTGNNINDINDYPSLFTGRLGHNREPTYSHVSISSDFIVITTYEVNSTTGISSELDQIIIVKNNCASSNNCAQCTNDTITFTNNQSLTNANFVISEELRIKNNSTVTFTNSTLKFYSNAEVVIEPGSKLVIDNTTLTNSCPNAMWHGITVLGDTTQPINPQYQGYVQLKNGATIENAHCAITVQGGGIVSATNANFLNNTVGVHFNPLASGQSGTSGTFYNTNFVLDSNYLGKMTDFENHIKMQNSGDVSVSESSFLSQAPQNVIYANKNIAIAAVNSNLRVGVNCPILFPEVNCPYGITEHNTFTGFARAISAANTGNAPILQVRYSQFENNYYGVHVTGINSHEIVRNSFSLESPSATGAYVSNSTGYKNEENEYENSFTGTAKQTVGLKMENSGTSENVVYKNSYTNLAVGQLFANVNSSQNPASPNPKVTGLQTVCNSFENNSYEDIRVGDYPIAFVGDQHHIRAIQGSVLSAAGNKFKTVSTYNIDVTQPLYATSYYYGSGIYQYPNSVSNVTRIAANTDNGCPLRNGEGSGIIIGMGRATKIDFTQTLQQYDEWNTQYKHWLKQLLATESGSELYEERQQMVAYYSSLKDNYFNSIVVETMSIWSTWFAEEENEDNGLFNDLRYLFSYRNHYTDNLSIAEIYMAEKNYNEALTTVTNIYQLFEINEEQFQELQGLETYIRWMQRLEESGGSIYKLPASEIAYLTNFVETNSGRGRVFANNILCELYEICMEQEAKMKETSHIARKEEEKSISNIENTHNLLDNITLYPNPTTGELLITSNKLQVISIEVFDIYGRKQSYVSCVTSSENVINISHLPSGSYFVKINTEAGDLVKRVVKQ